MIVVNKLMKHFKEELQGARHEICRKTTLHVLTHISAFNLLYFTMK